MSAILDKYKNSIGELKLNNLGQWNTKRGSDPTPYSDNAYQVDEPGIKKLEGEFGKTRYQLGQLGGGSPNSPGFTSTGKYSDSVEK